jgi:hypothetical protein
MAIGFLTSPFHPSLGILPGKGVRGSSADLAPFAPWGQAAMAGTNLMHQMIDELQVFFHGKGVGFSL